LSKVVVVDDNDNNNNNDNDDNNDNNYNNNYDCDDDVLDLFVGMRDVTSLFLARYGSLERFKPA